MGGCRASGPRSGTAVVLGPNPGQIPPAVLLLLHSTSRGFFTLFPSTWNKAYVQKGISSTLFFAMLWDGRAAGSLSWCTSAFCLCHHHPPEKQLIASVMGEAVTYNKDCTTSPLKELPEVALK